MQILPFCSEETLAKLEENILKMRPIADAPSDCKASDIVEAILDGIGVGDYNNAVSPLSCYLDDFQRDHDVCLAIAGLMKSMLHLRRNSDWATCILRSPEHGFNCIS
jgi:hypothetical protein